MKFFDSIDDVQVPSVYKFKEWERTARTNEKFVYFEGMCISGSIIGDILQKVVYKYATDGRVYLVRKRKDTDKQVFQFIAIKAGRTKVPQLTPLPTASIF